jgi:hypothetical protein
MSIEIAQTADDFGDHYYLADWTEHPQYGPLDPLPRNVDRQLARWLYNEATIEIDVDGSPVGISRCSRLLFNYNFATNDSVLLGDSHAGRLSVHLRFLTPLRSAGAAVSAIGPLGADYLAQCWLRLDDGQWHAGPQQQATLSRERGSAPFLGASATGGSAIVEVRFDVIDPTHQAQFLSAAINGLHFTPA